MTSTLAERIECAALRRLVVPADEAALRVRAWIAHAEDHHPDLEVGYKQCSIRYSTHDAGGLSATAFLCAAKVSALV